MANHPEHEEANASVENQDSSATPTENSDIAPSKTEGMRPKIQLITHYAKLAFAPFIAVLALIVATVAAIGNQSSQTQLSQTTAHITSISASQSGTKNELEKLKATLSQEKTSQEEERKQQNELEAKIIQNITQLQLKMKISPTLDEQLHQVINASAVSPTSSVPHAASAVPATAAITAPVSNDKKTSPKVQSIKEAIEKFNQK